MKSRKRNTVLLGVVLIVATIIGCIVVVIAFSIPHRIAPLDLEDPSANYPACGALEDIAASENRKQTNEPPAGTTSGDSLLTDTSNADAAGEPDDTEPEPEGPQATLVQPPPPLLAWNLTKQEYERLASDPQASPSEQLEAKNRLLLDFHRWPGRHIEKLGGFDFDQSKYRVLDGYERQNDKYTIEVSVHIDGNPPNVMLQRRIVLNKSPAHLLLNIRVMASREWAQRYFLAWIAGGARSFPIVPELGDEKGVYVGDVCSGNSEDALASQGKLKFVRHNVAVSIEFQNTRRDVEPRLLNVVALAQDIDREIQVQSRPAAEWLDLAPYCPVIDEFTFEADELPTPEGKLESQVKCIARHPEDKPIYYDWKGERYDLPKGGIYTNPGKPRSASVTFQGRVYEERPYKAWVVVYDDSLLFTVAEASILVRPPKDK